MRRPAREASRCTTQASCAWTAATDASWVSITSGTSGTGTGAVTFAVTANGGTAVRTASVTVANQPVSIHQDGRAASCTYRISPTSAAVTKDGGNGTFDVATGETCSWTATSSASWLTIASGTHGTGNGTITYTAARTGDAEGRTATIRAGGQTFTLQQTGDVGTCRYSVSPVAFSPCMPSTELETEVQTQAGCPWTSASGASWISMTAGQSASGPGTARFKITSNYDAPRQGVVMLRWPTPTAGQNVAVSQAGCTYAVSTATVSRSR